MVHLAFLCIQFIFHFVLLALNCAHPVPCSTSLAMFASAKQVRANPCVVSSGGAPTPAGTSVFTKHNWDMGMGYLWLNGWGIYHLMGGATVFPQGQNNHAPSP